MDLLRELLDWAVLVALLVLVVIYTLMGVFGEPTDTDRILGAVYLVGLMIAARMGRTARS